MSRIRNVVLHAMRPLANRVRLLVSRGVVTLVNDALKMQGVQVELHEGEVHDDVEHFQEFGFTSRAKGDGKAEALFLSVGGNRAAGVVACVADRRFRPTDLAEGDVCLYTEDGERVYLEKAGDIVNLGAKSAADFVALATTVDSRLDDLETFAGSHTHSVTVAATPFTGPTAPASGAPSGSSTAATKVKAT